MSWLGHGESSLYGPFFIFISLLQKYQQGHPWEVPLSPPWCNRWGSAPPLHQRSTVFSELPRKILPGYLRSGHVSTCNSLWVHRNTWASNLWPFTPHQPQPLLAELFLLGYLRSTHRLQGELTFLWHLPSALQLTPWLPQSPQDRPSSPLPLPCTALLTHTTLFPHPILAALQSASHTQVPWGELGYIGPPFSQIYSNVLSDPSSPDLTNLTDLPSTTSCLHVHSMPHIMLLVWYHSALSASSSASDPLLCLLGPYNFLSSSLLSFRPGLGEGGLPTVTSSSGAEAQTLFIKNFIAIWQ